MNLHSVDEQTITLAAQTWRSRQVMVFRRLSPEIPMMANLLSWMAHRAQCILNSFIIKYRCPPRLPACLSACLPACLPVRLPAYHLPVQWSPTGGRSRQLIVSLSAGDERQSGTFCCLLAVDNVHALTLIAAHYYLANGERSGGRRG